MPVMPNAPKLINPATVPPFVDPLPRIPLARASGRKYLPGEHGGTAKFFRIPIREISQKIHRDVPATRFWSYGGTFPGPTIEARSGEALLIEWPNELPAKHFLPIDHNLMGAEKDKPEVRTVVHVHGAKVPPESDGYPENWYTPGKSATYVYPNQQEAATLWYHDHSMGINRLNIMAGMVGLYLVRDPQEEELGLPSGEYELPLLLCDRLIRADGQLYYPVSQRPEAPWIPEFAGNAHLINGKLLPYLEVTPRKYRFRILNASNALFYFLSLNSGSKMQQIGSDQGLLQTPVALQRLSLAPGERADIVIDFKDQAGKNIVIQNGAVPILQFRVGTKEVVDASRVPSTLRPIQKLKESDAVVTRQLALVELDNVLDEPDTHLLDGKRWHEPISEKPKLNSTEIWSLVNTTDDSHPIHLHLVRFQILDRRAFDVTEYLTSKRIRFLGDAMPPDPGEQGWKDTVRASPGAVTRIIARFEGYAGRYVWHCHILEHEDNEMMRPYEVVAE
jgi:spore coat protein A, manganese oxidase